MQVKQYHDGVSEVRYQITKQRIRTGGFDGPKPATLDRHVDQSVQRCESQQRKRAAQKQSGRRSTQFGQPPDRTGVYGQTNQHQTGQHEADGHGVGPAAFDAVTKNGGG